MKLLADIYTRYRLSQRLQLWVHLVLIMLVGSAAYANSLKVPFILDDHFSISFYGTSSPLDLLLHGTTRRVAEASFALNYLLNGFSVSGYHIVNLSIHLCSAILLYFFARAALEALHVTFMRDGEAWKDTSFAVAFIPLASALLFTCHPLQTQAITYIIQRFTCLATLFYLAAALAFVRARICFELHKPSWRVWLPGCLSLLAAVLAMGSKQIAFTLPLMIVMLEFGLFRGRLLNRRLFIASVALLFVMTAYLLFTWLNGSFDDFLFDLRHATTEDYYFPRTTYFLTQTRVIVTYLRLLVLPIDQNLIYDYPLYTSIRSLPVLASITLHTTLLFSAGLLLRTSAQPSASVSGVPALYRRLAALGIFWFYIALAVESSIIPIRDVIFEHRVYLPSCGFFITLTSITAWIVHGQKRLQGIAWLLLVVICTSLGSLTIARNHVWRDPLTLWEDTVSKSPNKGLALTNLASIYLQRNIADKALLNFVRANEKSTNLDFRSKIGIGLSMQALNIYPGRFTTGQEYVLAGGTFNSGALDFSRLSEWDSVIANNQALAYEFLGEFDKAWKSYQLAIAINPDYDRAWFNLALLAARRGDRGQINGAIVRLKRLNPAMAQSLESTIVQR